MESNASRAAAISQSRSPSESRTISARNGWPARNKIQGAGRNSALEAEMRPKYRRYPEILKRKRSLGRDSSIKRRNSRLNAPKRE
jgi:hypothetical protein